eukprot:TRINITY_DN8655_c0_g1_i8.p1 TRINITY_DN8655_c0_g1~~TRINITY_DN8655_c0_g1_i8.p1  ORF type:complete len:119 (-),score=15.37 TRINITY_DN8655_c0_g1_i8:229-585(-)
MQVVFCLPCYPSIGLYLYFNLSISNKITKKQAMAVIDIKLHTSVGIGNKSDRSNSSKNKNDKNSHSNNDNSSNNNSNNNNSILILMHCALYARLYTIHSSNAAHNAAQKLCQCATPAK